MTHMRGAVARQQDSVGSHIAINFFSATSSEVDLPAILIFLCAFCIHCTGQFGGWVGSIAGLFVSDRY